MPEVTSPSAAQIIGVDDSTIRRYVYNGLLPARRQGLRKIIRIEVDDLKQFATKHQYRFNEELAAELAK